MGIYIKKRDRFNLQKDETFIMDHRGNQFITKGDDWFWVPIVLPGDKRRTEKMVGPFSSKEKALQDAHDAIWAACDTAYPDKVVLNLV